MNPLGINGTGHRMAAEDVASVDVAVRTAVAGFCC